MHGNATVKTVWARKRWLWAGAAAGVLALAVLAAILLPIRPSGIPVRLPAQTYRLTINATGGSPAHGRAYYLAGTHTPAQQQDGLGNIPHMAADQGMLFWYDNQDQRCFWMKDMRFPLDIIWLDSNKIVTHIEPSLTPATYPKVYCAPAQYVVELNAGEAARNTLSVGQAVTF